MWSRDDTGTYQISSNNLFNTNTFIITSTYNNGNDLNINCRYVVNSSSSITFTTYYTGDDTVDINSINNLGLPIEIKVYY